MMDIALQNSNPFLSDFAGKILITAPTLYQASIAVLVMYIAILLILLYGFIYFTRTSAWVNFAFANKWKSRMAICATSLLAIFLTNIIGGCIGWQVKGKLRFHSPDIITTALKLGSYAVVYNMQASTHIPQEQRDLLHCTRVLANEEIKKLLEKHPDALDSNMLIAPMSKESILHQIKLIQTGSDKTNPKLEPCLKVKLTQP